MSPTVPSLILIPSYNCCAVIIVPLVVKPSLRTACCCRVDVVKGAAGFLVLCFLSTRETLTLPELLSNNSPTIFFS